MGRIADLRVPPSVAGLGPVDRGHPLVSQPMEFPPQPSSSDTALVNLLNSRRDVATLVHLSRLTSARGVRHSVGLRARRSGCPHNDELRSSKARSIHRSDSLPRNHEGRRPHDSIGALRCREVTGGDAYSNWCVFPRSGRLLVLDE